MQEENSKKAAATGSSEPPDAVHGEQTDEAVRFEEEEGPTLRRDKRESSAPVASQSSPPRSSDMRHDSEQDTHGHAEHGLSHLTSIQLLLGVFGALIVLTVLTVMATGIDLGGEGNFIVAMIIATVKASLVMAYFMHLRWDNRLNVVIFLSSFLFVLLFLSLSLTDRKEYQDMVDLKERADALQGG